MKFHFRQAAAFETGEKIKKRHSFAKGHHEVPEEVQEHKFFKSMQKAGLISDSEQKEILAPEDFQSRQQKLAEKLLKPKEEIKAEDENPEAQAEESADESFDDEDTYVPGAAKKSKKGKGK